MIWPVKYDRINEGYTNHPPALDLAADRGVAIIAPENGVIDGRGDDLNYIGGYYLTMRGDSGYRYYMGHNSINRVSHNQRVSEGQHIADVGATGTQVTGPHVHFQMWNPQGQLIDPRSIIKSGEEDMNPTPKQAGDIFKGITGKDISQKDLDFYIQRPVYDLIYGLFPAAENYRDRVKLLEQDRDKNLYPEIEKLRVAKGLDRDGVIKYVKENLK